VVPCLLPEWRLRYVPGGGSLLPPAGAGSIRIREGVRPLRTAAAIIRHRLLAEGVRPVVQELGPIEPLITRQGEYGVLQSSSGLRHGQPFFQTTGVIFGDDFYTSIEGETPDPEAAPRFRQAVSELTLHYGIGQAFLRRRRYRYSPPPGWQAYTRQLIAEWQAPNYPSEMALITVFPARPIGETLPGALDRVLHEMSWFGYRNERLEEPEPALTEYGLEGVSWKTIGAYEDGVRMFTQIVVFQDPQFLYVLRLESSPDDHEAYRSTFESVLQTVQPVPQPPKLTVAAPQRANLLNQWGD
jgi:hypothetical protein